MNTRIVDLCQRPYLLPKRINITSRALCAAFAILGVLGVAQPASAATLLIDANGELTGATGVNVQGTLYDVAFVEGTCEELSLGCDAWTFTTASSATAAAQALLDQVFLGAFDTDSNLTYGCENYPICWVLTPYSIGPPVNGYLPALNVAVAINSSGTDFTYNQQWVRAADTSQVNFVVYADWTPAAVTAPEPGSLLLLGTGILAAAARRRHQKRS